DIIRRSGHSTNTRYLRLVASIEETDASPGVSQFFRYSACPVTSCTSGTTSAAPARSKRLPARSCRRATACGPDMFGVHPRRPVAVARKAGLLPATEPRQAQGVWGWLWEVSPRAVGP